MQAGQTDRGTCRFRQARAAGGALQEMTLGGESDRLRPARGAEFGEDRSDMEAIHTTQDQELTP